MKYFVVFLVCLFCLTANGQQEKRRRIKKKIVVQNAPEEVTEADVGLEEGVTMRQVEADTRPKEPRGFLDDYYKQFEARTEKVQSHDQMAQESLTFPRSFSQEGGASSERWERDWEKISSCNGNSIYRRQDAGDYDMETLMMREQQLQELLAREAELTPAQREEVLRQLAAWPSVAGQGSGQQAAVCREDDGECRQRMLVLEPDSPVVSADRRYDFNKLVSQGTSLHWQPFSQIKALLHSFKAFFPTPQCEAYEACHFRHHQNSQVITEISILQSHMEHQTQAILLKLKHSQRIDEAPGTNYCCTSFHFQSVNLYDFPS